MKKKNLVLRFNDGVVDSFATKEDLVEWFRKEGVNTLLLTDDCEEDEKDEGVGIEEGVDKLIQYGSLGVTMVCWNEELVEMGDDYVDIGVYEITVK